MLNININIWVIMSENDIIYAVVSFFIHGHHNFTVSKMYIAKFLYTLKADPQIIFKNNV